MTTDKPATIDEFIAGFPSATQVLMEQLRATIRAVAPEATETINYGIPTFILKGNLVHFSAYKNHIGFYPGASGIEAFKDALSGYKSAKGSVQFPIDEPMPLELVREIVQYRVQQNLEMAALKTTKRAKPAHFAAGLSAPAKRALENKGIKTLEQLANYSEADILALHGIGPSALPILRQALAAQELSFHHA